MLILKLFTSNLNSGEIAQAGNMRQKFAGKWYTQVSVRVEPGVCSTSPTAF
jgi:hypothetical protein